ncbi:MAG: DUF3822 family protein [Mucilaginibacter sp.]
MSNHKQHYRDTDFSAEQTGTYTLLVQIGQSSFSYAVIDQNKLLVFEGGRDLNELHSPKGEHNPLFSTYKNRIIGVAQKGFTFVPVSLFRPDLVANFARFLDVKTGETVFSQLLDSENQVIYKADDTVIGAITEKFDLKNIVFAAEGWINATAAVNPPDHHLYLNIDDDQVEILNFKGDKLRFYNSFEFKTEDELVYFTSLVAEELQLQLRDVTLVLSGNVGMDNKNTSRLAKFFGKVELNELKTLDLPEEISSHTVLTLTALSLCVSSEAL